MVDGPVELKPGMVVGKWKVAEPLGKGGQGAVWVVKPEGVKHSPQRALKVSFASDAQGRSRFEREVNYLRRCDSPYILKVHDHQLEWIERAQGLPACAFFVAERWQGSLSSRQHELGDARRKLTLFRQACAAIRYLHTLPDQIVHRDIKPDNFLLAKELSNLILADFGIARAQSDTALTQMFEVVGTPYYRAPEVNNGAPGDVVSDIYGLGRLLEWLMTGEVSQELSTRPVPRGGELADDACSLLDGIIAKATQVHPVHRYQSVQDLVDQLPDLWVSVKPRPKTEIVQGQATTAAVVPTAFEIMRTNDQLAWRDLRNQVRKDFVQRMTAWRSANSTKWPGDGVKEGGIAFTNAVVDIAMPTFALGLAGPYSGNAAFADQRKLFEELLALPGWSKGGTVAIAEAPKALAFVFSYLHGAVCITYEQPELAVQLVSVPSPDSRRDNVRPAWMDYGINGWPKLLNENCNWAWEYLLGLREKHTLLERFFVLPGDYDVAIASYSMLMVLNELAIDAASEPSEQFLDPKKFKLVFPPLFVAQSTDVVEIAARQVFGNSSLVDRVAERAGAKHETMKRLWDARRQKILGFRRDANDRFGWYDEGSIPKELA